MSFLALTVGAMAQCDKPCDKQHDKDCDKQDRKECHKDFGKPHKPRMHCMANLHAMKKAGIDSVTIEKVKELHKDTTLCKDREAYNKKVRKLLGTDSYIKYLETAVAEKNFLMHGHHGMHPGHHRHHGHHHWKPGMKPGERPMMPADEAPDAPED